MSGLISIWKEPDTRAVEIGREGEISASRLRLLIVSVAIIIPLAHAIGQARDPEPWVGVGTGVAIFVLGAAFARLARRPVPPPWLNITSCLMDVSIVSAANVAFILSGQPLAATNGRVFFPAYLLALSLTCLRNDVRLCIVTGSAAVLQYATIVAVAVGSGNVIGLVHPTYGTFRWDNQVTRLAILALATVINVMIIRQSQRYVSESMYDHLTGLPNRRYARARLDDLVHMAVRTRRPFVVAVADLDRFKQINDAHGHAAGDALLRHVARLLRSHFRAGDLISRYGGEEFVIALPDSEPEGALERISRFRAIYAASRLPADCAAIGPTISIGVAVYPADGTSPDDLLAKADQRLYEAKRAGRDRVIAPAILSA